MDPLPPFHRTALLLDMDGTLIDLAPTPDAVTVPPGLVDVLVSLREALGGALAIVTGRPVETVDRLFGDAPGAVAGEHGGAIRHARGEPIERPNLPAPPSAWLEAAEALVRSAPGALLERKARGFALHYRQVPEARDVFHNALTALIDARFEVHPAHMLWEVRPVGADKGHGVAALMQRVPFAERLPVFIGDDVTDEDGIRAAQELGGYGVRVGGGDSAARYRLADTDAVAAWLGTAPLDSAGPGIESGKLESRP
jgi:trehalose 6-phosphate phosphatase